MSREVGRISKLIPLLIKLGNKMVDWRSLFRELGIPEDRTMKIVVVDLGYETGLALRDGKLVEARDLENPTVTVEIPSNVFWAIIAGKMSAYQAWLMGLVRFRGQWALRDAYLLTKLFDELRRVVARVKP